MSTNFRDVTIKSRNAIIASPGHELVAFDISQADIRALAHAADSFPYTAEAYLKRLQNRRLHRLGDTVAVYRQQMWQFFQPQNRKVFRCPHCSAPIEFTENQAGTTIPCPTCQGLVELPSQYPKFDPSTPCALAEDFCRGDSDFYTVATERMLGHPPKDKTERDHMKQTILGIVNGMSAAGLAQRLDVEKDVAKGYMAAFAKAYPKVEAFRELTRYAYAITGESWTFAGHHRRITPHYWMATRSQVDLFISYKGADKLWVRVVPLRPNRHTLTCWVLRVIDARYGSQMALEMDQEGPRAPRVCPCYCPCDHFWRFGDGGDVDSIQHLEKSTMSELKYKKEWRQLGLVPRRGEEPRRIRRFHYGGEGHLYVREQMRPLQVHRKPIPQLVEATVANVMLACFTVTRTAKRLRDAATRCYEARAFSFASYNSERKADMYDLKANALCWLIARGAVQPEGLANNMTVWRGGGYCFHSQIGPTSLVTLSAEHVLVEAKPKTKAEMRLIDAVALLRSLPDEPLPDGMIRRNSPCLNAGRRHDSRADSRDEGDDDAGHRNVKWRDDDDCDDEYDEWDDDGNDDDSDAN